MLCLFDNFEQVVDAGPELAAASLPVPTLTSSSRAGSACASPGSSLPRPTARRVRRRGASSRRGPVRSILPSPRASRSASSACASTSFRSRSSSPPPGRPSSARAAPRPAFARLDLLKGSRDADPRQQTLRRRSRGRTTSSHLKSRSSSLGSPLLRRLPVRGGRRDRRRDPDTLQSLLDKSLLRNATHRSGRALDARGDSRVRTREARRLGRGRDSCDVTSRTTSLSPRPSTSSARSATTSSGDSKRSATISAAPSTPRSRSTPSRRSIWPGGLASTGTGEVSIVKVGRGSRPLSRRLPLLEPPLAPVHSARPAISLSGREISPPPRNSDVKLSRWRAKTATEVGRATRSTFSGSSPIHVISLAGTSSQGVAGGVRSCRGRDRPTRRTAESRVQRSLNGRQRAGDLALAREGRRYPWSRHLLPRAGHRPARLCPRGER